jgi:hypothetical protein
MHILHAITKSPEIMVNVLSDIKNTSQEKAYKGHGKFYGTDS